MGETYSSVVLIVFPVAIGVIMCASCAEEVFNREKMLQKYIEKYLDNYLLENPDVGWPMSKKKERHGALYPQGVATHPAVGECFGISVDLVSTSVFGPSLISLNLLLRGTNKLV